MAVLLALGSALGYGIADFVGGLLARRADPTLIALVGQVGALVLTAGAAPWVPATGLEVPDLAVGALSGVGTGIGMVFLYRGLEHGNMSVVVPVVAVGGTAIPVLFGIALLGDRPTLLAWLGIGLALPALWLISIRSRSAGATSRSGTAQALISSLGIAVQYIALAQAGPEAGLWPIVAGRVAASLTILPMVLHRPGRPQRVGLRLAALAVGTGGIAALALTLYMLAAQRELVTIAVVLSSLYPVVPVLLGITLLREGLTLRQGTGLAAATIAVVLITTG